ncbi:MAG: hypothetical protein IIA54_03030 [Chloroflexi bacterium]|nr:hypothetical protein [Chloroflexota bacterium]
MMRRLGTAVGNLLWSLWVAAVLAAVLFILFVVAMLWPVRPPGAVLTVDGVEQKAGVGTYCWDSWLRGICVDSPGPVTPSQPLVVHSPVLAELRVGDGQPSIHFRVLPAGQDDGPRDTSRSTRTWLLPREMHESALLDEALAAGSRELRFALEPGLYVLSVSAQWPGRGRDASYGFLLSVVER